MHTRGFESNKGTIKGPKDMQGKYCLQPFTNVFYNGATEGNILGAALLPQPQRYDRILMTGISATYELLKGFEANIHGYYIRDESNINLYNYHRYIVGGQLSYRY